MMEAFISLADELILLD